MRIVDVGDDGVADNGDGEGEEHYRASEAEAVGDDCYDNYRKLGLDGLFKIEVGVGDYL
jgi:hypothetical protein